MKEFLAGKGLPVSGTKPALTVRIALYLAKHP